MKIKKIREMTDSELIKSLNDLKLEVMKEKAKSIVGGVPENPGKIKANKRDIARILTVMRERNIKE